MLENEAEDDDLGGPLTLDNDSGTQVATRTLLPRVYDESPALRHDPSQFGWPPTMVIELALQTGTVKSICEDYGIDREGWDVIRSNPHFIAELGRTVEALKSDGMAFKARSQLQAMGLLKESWKLIHDRATPANVKADLIKSTIRWSGLDASKDAALQSKPGAGFSIVINMA